MFKEGSKKVEKGQEESTRVKNGHEGSKMFKNVQSSKGFKKFQECSKTVLEGSRMF